MGDKKVGVFRCLITILIATIFIGLASYSTTPVKGANAQVATTTPRQRTLLDADWLFHLSDISPERSGHLGQLR